MRATTIESAAAGGLVAVAGLLAWATGRPFVFPSLGPTAYVLATSPDAATATPRRVLGGHLVGVVVGLAAYHALAGGAVVTAVGAAFAVETLRLAASATVSVAATTGGMAATGTRHPPACATTLIVSLGLLSSPTAGVVVMVAVAVLVAVHAAIRRPAPLA